MKKYRWMGALVLFCTLTVGLLWSAQLLLTPHDRAANPEAFLLREYLEATDAATDEVLFVGDCEVYEAFSPVTLYQEYGIVSRVCGTPQQLIWHTWAILEEAFRRSSPRVVVMGVYGLTYGTPQSEAYNRMALEALPNSAAKRELLQSMLCEEESRLSYTLPLLRYHDRWRELTVRDVTTLWQEQAPNAVRGYLVQTGVVPGDVLSHEGGLARADAFGEMALDYFARIVALCAQNGAQLILVKAPTDSWRYPWLEEYEEKTLALAEQYDLPYYNFLNAIEEIGLDFATDTYDGGYHLNVYGAEKLSKYFGQILSETYDLTDGRVDAVKSAVWAEEIARYEAEKGRREQ